MLVHIACLAITFTSHYLRDIDDDDYYPRTFSHVHGTRETRFPYPLVRPAGKPRGTSGYEVAQVSLFSVSIPRVNNSDIDTHFFISQGSCWCLLFFGLLYSLLPVFACPRVKDKIVNITIISLDTVVVTVAGLNSIIPLPLPRGRAY